jgi:hypothetical protein
MKSNDNEKIKKTQPSLNFFKEILKYIHHYQLKIKFKIASYFI